MKITCKQNGQVVETLEREITDSGLLSQVKSSYGKFFYESDPSEIFSVDVECDGLTFLRLYRDQTGKVIHRLSIASETLK